MAEGSNVAFLSRKDSGEQVSGEEGHHEVKVGSSHFDILLEAQKI